ncbi:MAG TPA: cupin domain-containing protein [Gaiellaceae bacterium]|nr:cupin domain-containing protein [Gaiellaceae bacterium]
MINLRDCELEPIDGPEGHRFRALHPASEAGAKRTGFGIYELDPGQATWPYHFELGSEEWLLVIEGEVVVRTPDGDRALRAGDVVCFPEGPAGAHSIRNESGAPARFAMPSVDERAGAAIYPDSRKLAVHGPGFRHRGWIGDEVEYWEGE